MEYAPNQASGSRSRQNSEINALKHYLLCPDDTKHEHIISPFLPWVSQAEQLVKGHFVIFPSSAAQHLERPGRI